MLRWTRGSLLTVQPAASSVARRQPIAEHPAVIAATELAKAADFKREVTRLSFRPTTFLQRRARRTRERRQRRWDHRRHAWTVARRAELGRRADGVIPVSGFHRQSCPARRATRPRPLRRRRVCKASTQRQANRGPASGGAARRGGSDGRQCSGPTLCRATGGCASARPLRRRPDQHSRSRRRAAVAGTSGKRGGTGVPRGLARALGIGRRCR